MSTVFSVDSSISGITIQSQRKLPSFASPLTIQTSCALPAAGCAPQHVTHKVIVYAQINTKHAQCLHRSTRNMHSVCTDQHETRTVYAQINTKHAQCMHRSTRNTHSVCTDQHETRTVYAQINTKHAQCMHRSTRNTHSVCTDQHETCTVYAKINMQHAQCTHRLTTIFAADEIRNHLGPCLQFSGIM